MRSIPINPADGTLLTWRPDSDTCTFQGYQDLGLGDHAVCGGMILLAQVSETNHAMRCLTCGMRVLVPSTVQNIGDLCRALAALSAPDVPTLTENLTAVR